MVGRLDAVRRGAEAEGALASHASTRRKAFPNTGHCTEHSTACGQHGKTQIPEGMNACHSSMCMAKQRRDGASRSAIAGDRGDE